MYAPGKSPLMQLLAECVPSPAVSEQLCSYLSLDRALRFEQGLSWTILLVVDFMTALSIASLVGALLKEMGFSSFWASWS